MHSPDNSLSQPPPLYGSLRSTSPAIKRPASDMGAQEREEHEDVAMLDAAAAAMAPLASPSLQPTASDVKAKQQCTDDHHNSPDKVKDLGLAGGPGGPGGSDTHTTASASSVFDSALTTPSVRSTATAATWVSMDVAPTAADRPSINEQIATVIALSTRALAEREKGYAISNAWLGRVFARSSSPPPNYDKAAAEGDIGPVDNSDLSLATDDRLVDLAGDRFVPLRAGLQMGQDYEMLPCDAWELIVSWYGLAKDSPVIVRYAYNVAQPDALAPEIKWETDPPVKYMQTQDWLRQAKAATGIDAATRITANAGDRMLLDVATFAALSLGDQRERLEIDDQTGNANYNGSSTLALIGQGRSDVIVLEEQRAGAGGPEWPSDQPKLADSSKLRGLAAPASARSSAVAAVAAAPTAAAAAPAPGPTTRGRALREGRSRGITGLSNLGNTCYMNSALQSLRSVRELTDYFLHDAYKRELNRDNPLGHDGNVALAYGQLIHHIYADAANSCSPSKFKATIGRYGPSFSGYQQQDSQEFLLFLIDGLNEDLNRIRKKPYIEKADSTDAMVADRRALQAFAHQNWLDYKARNDSVVTDLFAGMYKSQLTCPECHKVSIIFDPFTNLTLPLPVENSWSKDVAFVPLYGPPISIDVDLDKTSSMRALKHFVAARTHVDADLLVVAEDYRNRFYRIFDNAVALNEASIQSNDIICLFQLDQKPTNYNPDKVKKKASSFSVGVANDDDVPGPADAAADRLLVPVFHRHVRNPDARVPSRPFFGLPAFIVVSREENASYEAILRKLLARAQTLTTKDLFADELEPAERAHDDAAVVVMTEEDASSSSGPAMSPADSSEESTNSPVQAPSMTDSEDPGSDFHRVAKSRGHSRHARIKTFKRKGKLIRAAVHDHKAGSHEAYDALFGGSPHDDADFRGTPAWKNVTTLPDPELQAKRQLRASRRKNGISLQDCLDESRKPEILSEQNAWYCPRCKTHRRAEKTFELWKCPDILIMHLKRFSSNRNFRDKLDVRVDYPIQGLDMSPMIQDVEDGKSMVYDLIAVDNHYGGLGGGHYTAFARHPTTNQWYEYNDASVSKRNPDAVVTSAAYLLFYRRPHPVGGGGPASLPTSRLRGPTPDGDRRSRRQSLENDEVDVDGLGPHLPDYTEATSGAGPLDDEGLGAMDYEQDHEKNHDQVQRYGPVEQSWDWGNIKRPHNNSEVDDDVFRADRNSSNSSTKAASRGTSVNESMAEQDDIARFSDDIGTRSMRESAPPPGDDYDTIALDPMIEDDDGELPVVELRTDSSGDVQITEVPK
ncbi:hypothetical protein DV737_g5280, partial [Chaetothyriales sp. CBS 132003]